ncbi:MAG: hypothetical protein LBM99_02220 [Bacillales bacterium]|jgi:hypothetical protein|nr:hypothetical protein [Bacillales bacterium]
MKNIKRLGVLFVAIVGVLFGLASCVKTNSSSSESPKVSSSESSTDLAGSILDKAENAIAGFWENGEVVNSSVADFFISVSKVTVGGVEYNVSISWATDKETVITSAGAVIRPDAEEGGEDTTVVITATLTYETRTRDHDWSVLVEAVQFTGTILTVSELYGKFHGIKPATPDANKLYPGDQVRILNAVVVQTMASGYLVSDGTATAQVYLSNHGRTVGEKGKLTGLLINYYDQFEIGTNVAFTVESEGAANPETPVANGLSVLSGKGFMQVVEGKQNHIAGYADALVVAKESADIHKAVEIEAKVVAATTLPKTVVTPTASTWVSELVSASRTGLITSHADDAEYQLYLVDQTDPAKFARVHYTDPLYNTLRTLNGEVVTVNAWAYSLRDDYAGNANYSWASHGMPTWYLYVLGIADLTPEQIVAADKASLAIQTEFNVAGTIDLPEAGANGSTITWDYKETSANNAYINLGTGAVTLPEEGQVEVKLVATLTKEGTSDTKDFTVKVGQLTVLTIQELKTKIAGATSSSTAMLVKTQGIITMILPYTSGTGVAGNPSWFLEDATGGVYAYSTPLPAQAVVGTKIEVTAFAYTYQGLPEIVNTPDPAVITIVSQTNELPLATLNEVPASANNTDHVAERKEITGLFQKEGSNYFVQPLQSEGRFQVYLATVSVLGNSAEALTALNTALTTLVGKLVTVTAPLYLSGGTLRPYVIASSQVVEVSPLSDQQSVLIAALGLSLPASATENLTLATAGSNGTAISWASDKPASISTAGVVVRTEEDVTVTLTATITKGTASTSKTFEVVVTGLASVVELSSKIVGTNPSAYYQANSIGTEYFTGVPSGFSIVFEKATSSNGPRLDTDGQVRLYFGNTITITSATQNIRGVVLEFGAIGSNPASSFRITIGETVETLTPVANSSSARVSGSALTALIGNIATGSNTTYLKSITIWYAE